MEHLQGDDNVDLSLQVPGHLHGSILVEEQGPGLQVAEGIQIPGL
jgi:hypothetical protein